MDSKTNEDEDRQRLEEALGRSIVEERIDKSTLTPLFDGNHEHTYVPDPSDRTATYQAEVCTKCSLGRLVRLV